MKKLLVVITLLLVLLLTGCQNQKEDNALADENEKEQTVNQLAEESLEGSIDVNQYEAEWRMAKDADKDVYSEGGDALTIKATGEKMIDFELNVVQEPPANRVAQIKEKNISLDDNNTGTFTWEDSWFNTGKGTIKLNNQKVIIQITDTQISEDAMWRVFDGTYVFDQKLD